jgi:hypothetical protein
MILISDDVFSQMYPPQPEIGSMPEMPVLAMAYVPFQEINAVYEPEQALAAGTLFPGLDKPFLGRRL